MSALGARVMALRHLFNDIHSKEVVVFLFSTYAPLGNASDEEWDEYFDNLSSCMNKRHKGGILTVGSDCNSLENTV